MIAKARERPNRTNSVIEPDIQPVYEVYDQNPTLVDQMRRFGPKEPHWSIFANDFVLNIDSQPMVKSFVERVYQAKIKVEQKMRTQLDQKIMSMAPSSNTFLALGSVIVRRLRTYIKL